MISLTADRSRRMGRATGGHGQVDSYGGVTGRGVVAYERRTDGASPSTPTGAASGDTSPRDNKRPRVNVNLPVPRLPVAAGAAAARGDGSVPPAKRQALEPGDTVVKAEVAMSCNVDFSQAEGVIQIVICTAALEMQSVGHLLFRGPNVVAN